MAGETKFDLRIWEPGHKNYRIGVRLMYKELELLYSYLQSPAIQGIVRTTSNDYKRFHF